MIKKKFGALPFTRPFYKVWFIEWYNESINPLDPKWIPLRMYFDRSSAIRYLKNTGLKGNFVLVEREYFSGKVFSEEFYES